MASRQSLLIPPPSRGSNLSGSDRKYLQTLQRQLPMQTVDTSAGPYAENAPPAGVNSQSGETNQNQEITYIKTSSDGNVFTLNGVEGGPYTLTSQFSFLRIKSEGTRWYVNASTAAPPIPPPSPATAIPLVDAGAGAVGASLKYAREDHVHPASGGGAGSLAGTVTLFADETTPTALDLSTEGTLDWMASNNSQSGAPGGSQIQKGNASLAGFLNKTYRAFAFGGSFGPAGGSAVTVHSDAVDSSGNAFAASGAWEAVGVGNNPTWLNWGFEIEAMASASVLRKLNLYIPVTNGTIGQSVTFKLIAHMSDESSADLVISKVAVDTSGAVVHVYKANIQFQAATAGARLRVTVVVTGFTGSMQFVNFGLQCATLFT